MRAAGNGGGAGWKGALIWFGQPLIQTADGQQTGYYTSQLHFVPAERGGFDGVRLRGQGFQVFDLACLNGVKPLRFVPVRRVTALGAAVRFTAG